MRYLFLCPEVSAASGGVAVIYACVEHLRNAGYDACILHSRFGYRYGNTPYAPPVLVSAELAVATASGRRRHQRLVDQIWKMRSHVGRLAEDETRIEDEDVLVVPEFMLDDVAAAWPDQPKVILSQNSFAFVDAHHRAAEKVAEPDKGVICNLGISDTCMEAFSLMSDRPQLRIVVSPDLTLFPFSETKRRKIVYMPRKRPVVARQLHAALVRRGKVDDHEIVSLDSLPQAEVARHMRDSLIFVSLMKEEALGFPGIEAMASGCIVVGYTGLGTEEYFTPETGVPVREGDTAGLVMAVERVAAEYRHDSRRLDALRRHASESVRARYNPQAFEDSLLTAWARIATLAGDAAGRPRSVLRSAENLLTEAPSTKAKASATGSSASCG